jgi:peptidoglycan-associated lipoprotein
MSIMKIGKGLTIIASTVLLFSCAGSNTNSSSGENMSGVNTHTISSQKTAQQIALEQNKAARDASNTVFFELDSDAVSPMGRSVLEAHSWYLALAENSSTIVSVDGHCDERGTPAYNLALGERRAKAVAQILMSYGVSRAQIKTISHGEEMPAVDGHNESAWSQNRRAVLDYAE